MLRCRKFQRILCTPELKMLHAPRISSNQQLGMLKNTRIVSALELQIATLNDSQCSMHSQGQSDECIPGTFDSTCYTFRGLFAFWCSEVLRRPKIVCTLELNVLQTPETSCTVELKALKILKIERLHSGAQKCHLKLVCSLFPHTCAQNSASTLLRSAF